MTDLLPITFPKPGERPLASFNWYDLADGTGIIEFMPCKVNTGDGTYDYIMTTNSAMYSSTDGSTTLGDGNGALVQEFDFDIVLNLPRIVAKADCIVSIPLSLYTPGGTSSVWVKARLYHYDGSTETAMTSQITGDTWSSGASGSVQYKRIVIQLPITSKTRFAKGDILRLNIEAWSQLDNNPSNNWAVGHSPASQTSAWTTGQKLNCLIPFEVQ